MSTRDSPGPDHGRGIVLIEGSATILRERVAVRLMRHPGGSCVLERSLEQDDGMRLIQIFPVDCANGLHDFCTADPYYDVLEATYDMMQAQYRMMATEDRSGVSTYGAPGPIDVIGDVASCSDEGELAHLVRIIVRTLGADQWTYQAASRDDRAGTLEHRYLIGCAPGWIQRYLRDKRFMADPFVEYARRNVTPVTGSMLGLADGALRMAAEARRFGIRSHLAVPAHAPAVEAMGLLHVSHPRDPKESGEAPLWSNRVLFSALATALLGWQMATARRMAADRFELDPGELEVLRVLVAGGYAHHVADMLRISVRQVHRVVFPRICEKMNVPRIDEAKKLAIACGLIGPTQGEI
jgi:hypothetical protein